jgi:outer membrane protein assembly factor BamA
MPSCACSISSISTLGIDHHELVGAFQQALIADLRDHPIEPRFGLYGEVRVSEGGPFAGGGYTYQQVVPELRGYAALGPVVLAARARYGAIFGEVPPSERFYAGGASSHRGFGERELSPSVTGPVNGSTVTVPYGGAGMIESSFEARFPIMTIRSMPLGGLVFVDAGDVTQTPGELSLGRLIYAVGPGLRLSTPVGPVRVDVGYRLNRTGPMDPEPLSRYAFHLSLGEAF